MNRDVRRLNSESVSTARAVRNARSPAASLRAALTVITLLTLGLATATASVVLSAKLAHPVDDLLILGVVLGLPLSTTLLGSRAWSMIVLGSSGAALVACAAIAAGITVGQLALNAGPGGCDMVPASCGLSLDSPSATMLGAILVGIVPAVTYLATARALRDRPAKLAVTYLVSLPAFAVWVGFLAALAQLMTSAYNVPVD